MKRKLVSNLDLLQEQNVKYGKLEKFQKKYALDPKETIRFSTYIENSVENGLDMFEVGLEKAKANIIYHYFIKYDIEPDTFIVFETMPLPPEEYTKLRKAGTPMDYPRYRIVSMNDKEYDEKQAQEIEDQSFQYIMEFNKAYHDLNVLDEHVLIRDLSKEAKGE